MSSDFDLISSDCILNLCLLAFQEAVDLSTVFLFDTHTEALIAVNSKVLLSLSFFRFTHFWRLFCALQNTLI